MLQRLLNTAAFVALWAAPAAADPMLIVPDVADVQVVAEGRDFLIARTTDDPLLTCPPKCVQPMQAAAGVQTLGALEVIGFLRANVAQNLGQVLDVRLPAAFAASRVPGAINVPFATLASQNPSRRDILLALGVRDAAGALDFGPAPVLVVYADGVGDDLAANAVRSLREAGYPADKLLYFRNGLQEWLQLGLTVSGAANQG